EDEVVSLLEKEKANLETIESLKSKGFESRVNAISESENQSENDCQVIEKECDQVENSKVIALGMMFKAYDGKSCSVDKLCGKVSWNGLGDNLFSVGQFCDKGLEVAFRKSTCFVQNENGVDLLTGDLSLNLYAIALNEVASNSSTCLLAKASSSQSWLWYQRLSPLNFATINNLVKNNLVQVVVDDYSWYTWGFFLHSKDEASDVIIYFIKKTQVKLQLQVQRVRTNNGTEFKNKTLAKFFDEVGISQQFSAARTPQQNGVVEKRNQTSVEAARTMMCSDVDVIFSITMRMLESSRQKGILNIMKSSTTNVETSNIEVLSNEEEVFHESSESFQEESSSSSLNDDVQ
nr:integrase, catalytic region, zinc finger, CCHC-type, peptidase aspartic, catalytic [Tanacetum cinerariifolium]